MASRPLAINHVNNVQWTTIYPSFAVQEKKKFFLNDDRTKQGPDKQYMSHHMTKSTKWPVHPVKTHISLGTRPVWSLFAVRKKKVWTFSYLLSALWRLTRLGGCPGWSESSLGAQAILLVLSCAGSCTVKMSHDMTKPTMWHVRPVKTQISLGICPVWSESSLSEWRKVRPLATHWAHSKDWSDWAKAQVDLSLRWPHTHFVGFVTRRLKLENIWTPEKLLSLS